MGRPSGLRLICFPYAGGASVVFKGWDQLASSHIAVVAAELPGRGRRFGEPAISRMPAMVSLLMEELAGAMQEPHAFFGHSMGALIAFELAREQRRRGWPGPLYFFASGHRAPQLPHPGPFLHELSMRDFVEGLRRYGGTPKAVLDDPEMVDLFVPMLRADFTIAETYRYVDDAPLDCPIFAFAGSADPFVSLPEVEAWKSQTRSAFGVASVPGGHFFLNDQRPLMLKTIQTQLAPLLMG